MAPLLAHDYVPDIFTLVYDTWGLRVVDSVLLPAVFLLLTTLFIFFAPLATIHGPRGPVGLMRVMVMGGALFLCAGFVIQTILLVEPTLALSLAVLGSILPPLGMLLLGAGLLFSINRVYDTAC